MIVWGRLQVVFAGVSVSAMVVAAGCGSSPSDHGTTGTSADSAQPAVVATVTDSATAAGHTLEIRSVDGACVLRVSPGAGGTAREYQLLPKAPCHFLRAPGNRSPQVRAYRDVATDAVLVVSGTPVSDATRARWKLASDLVCGEESQGVLIRAGQIVVTTVRRGGVTCRDAGVDEKEYWAFAHDEP